MREREEELERRQDENLKSAIALEEAFKGLQESVRGLLDDLIALRKAVKPIIAAYAETDNPGNSDLDNEQPYSVHVTLGDLRQLDRLLKHWRPK